MTKRKLFLPLIVLLFLLTTFLFSFNVWLQKTQPSAKTPTESNILNDYQHPLIPQVGQGPAPAIAAQAYIVVDNATNTILLSKNPHDKIYPASITKLATALTALNIYPLDELVTVKNTYHEGKVMNLVPGETLTVRSLVTALLVYSANDAAYNLASHHPQGNSGFINQMNILANEYNFKDTHFVNFDGIHSPDHYSSVSDLAELGRLAIKNSIIKEVVKNKTITVADITEKNSHQLTSTNELLGVIPEIEGLKTGWTPEAGGCFVALINLHGHQIISVVAQSPDRFADTTAIVNWAKQNITWSSYQP